MASDPGADDRAEWLESGRPRFAGRDARVLIGAVVLALIVTAVSVGVYQRSSATAPVPQPSTSPSSSAPATPSSDTSTARAKLPSASNATPTTYPNESIGPARTRRLRAPLLGVTEGWELVGHGPDGLVRVQPARGTIITQGLPSIATNNNTTVTTGRDFVVVLPADNVRGILVVDGKPVVPVDGALATAQQVLAGPDQSHLWAVSGPRVLPSEQRLRIRLVDRAGRAAGPELPVIRGSFPQVLEDGTGHVVLIGTGGAYLSRPGGLSRITTGELLAIGPTRFLTAECDDRGRCRTVVIDRGSGARRDLGAAIDERVFTQGVISPDGRWASVLALRADGSAGVLLIDLVTGKQREPDLSPAGQQPQVWSPDSRWLLVTNQTQLSVFDVTTGAARVISEVSEQLHVITIRPAVAP